MLKAKHFVACHTAFDVMQRCGIHRERLREWMARGFITPTVSASGVGTKALFTDYDVFLINVFKILVESGLNRKSAKMCVSKLSPQDLDSQDAIIDLGNGVALDVVIDLGNGVALKIDISW
jgi:DNA-binding transcriptional MerR regulator